MRFTKLLSGFLLGLALVGSGAFATTDESHPKSSAGEAGEDSLYQKELDCRSHLVHSAKKSFIAVDGAYDPTDIESKGDESIVISVAAFGSNGVSKGDLKIDPAFYRTTVKAHPTAKDPEHNALLNAFMAEATKAGDNSEKQARYFENQGKTNAASALDANLQDLVWGKFVAGYPKLAEPTGDKNYFTKLEAAFKTFLKTLPKECAHLNFVTRPNAGG